jgi:hypothetical protein
MATESTMQEVPRLMLFVNARPSRAEAMIAPSEVARAVRASEVAWARRAGIEDAPFRVAAASRDDFSTINETMTGNGGDAVQDKQSPDFADSEYATDTERGKQVRDRQSPD